MDKIVESEDNVFKPMLCTGGYHRSIALHSTFKTEPKIPGHWKFAGWGNASGPVSQNGTYYKYSFDGKFYARYEWIND